MLPEREMLDILIEGLREHIAALEKTCTDLRHDKAALRKELNALQAKSVSQEHG